MRCLTLGLVGLLLISVVSSLQAEETEGEKAFKSYGEAAVGGIWKSTQQVVEREDDQWKPTGEVNEVATEYHWFADKKFLQLIGTWNGKRGDRLAILGVAPKTNEFTWWRFGGNGLRVTACTPDKDGNWIFQGTLTDPDGREIEWKRRLRLVDKNTLSHEPMEAFVDGEPADKSFLRPPTVWTRHDATLAAAPLAEDEEVAEETAETEADTAYKSYAEFMADAVWKHTGDDGQEQIRRYRWLANQKFLYATIGANEQQPDAIAIYGINPSTEKLGAWHFGKSGLLTITVTPHGDNVWLSEGSLTNEAGTKIGWKGQETRIGPNEVHVELLETTENGQKVERPEWSQTWKRHKD